MNEKIRQLILKLADKIETNQESISVLEDDLLEEIIEAGYELPQGGKNALLETNMNLFRRLKDEKNAQAMSLFLRALIENIQYMQQCMDKYHALTIRQERPHKKNTIIRMDTREVFAQQNQSVSEFAYNRLDTVVRYLAIENYYGENTYGFALYGKMQSARMGNEYTPYSIDRYKELIASFEKTGYDEKSCITCDQNLKLVDGSHRLALCLYHGIPNISIQVLPQRTHIEYGVEWFQENGFTEEEIQIICEKCIQLMEQNIVPFTCILWPPVQKYFEEITNLLSEAYEVVSVEDFEYKEETFERLVRGIYHIDDIEDWKIEKKLTYMSDVPLKRVRLLKLYFVGPDFRLKQMNGKTLSKVGEHIKKVIRNDYQNKVDNYFYDIIIHTGDNFQQNEYISKLFQPAFELGNYLESIEEFPYVLTKIDVPYQTDDFPNSYAFSKDLDILVGADSYLQLVEHTIAYLQECVDGYELVGLESESNYRIRIELQGYLIFQLDISKNIEGLPDDFSKKCISERKKIACYYTTTVENEIGIRIAALIKNPHKQHHWEYLKQHRHYLDEENLIPTYGKNEVEVRDIIDKINAEEATC